MEFSYTYLWLYGALQQPHVKTVSRQHTLLNTLLMLCQEQSFFKHMGVDKLEWEELQRARDEQLVKGPPAG